MPESSREKLITAASEIFYAQGFHSVGLDQVIDAVGVTKTTFYNHFESKDDLIVEVLKRLDELDMRKMRDELDRRAGDDPRARMLTFFDVIHDWFHEDTFNGCIFLRAAIEFPSPHDPVHHAAAAHGASIHAALLELARDAGAERPDELAEHLTMLVHGAVVTYDMALDRMAARKARVIAEALLDKALKAARA